MSPEDIADANLLQSMREHARWQDPCECVETNGMLLVAGANDVPIGYRNCAARVDRNLSAREALERTKAFFAERRRGFSLLIRANYDADLESLLVPAGLKQRSDIPSMLIDAPIAEKELPQGISVRTFKDERCVRDAVEIVVESYEMLRLPAQETRVYFMRTKELMSNRVEGYVAYRDEQPLSTALTIFSPRGAGVYWVGTSLRGQRSGLAAICTIRATNIGFERGAKIVALQASPFGEPIYRRLGYREYDRMKWYSYPAPA